MSIYIIMYFVHMEKKKNLNNFDHTPFIEFSLLHFQRLRTKADENIPALRAGQLSHAS